MNGKQIVTKLDYLLHWIVRLVMLNVLWIVFSVCGLVAVGIFPATTAVLGVARKWQMGEEDLKIWNTFKQIYRQEFLASNMMGWILSIVGIILYLNYQALSILGDEIVFYVPFAFYFIVFFYTILVIWSFPLLTHYKATCLQHFKNGIIIGLSKIHYTILSGTVIFAGIYFSLSYPGVIPFFTVSVIGMGCMWFSLQIFRQLDGQQKKPSNTSEIEEQPTLA